MRVRSRCVTLPTSRPRRLRVGAVSYLNTKPLIYRFAEFARVCRIDSGCTESIGRSAGRRASLDVALIPSIEAFQNPGYAIVSDACIACRGPVLSVKLLSRVPIPAIRSLALDEGSRTSVALVRILLHQRHGLTPSVEPLPIGRGLDAIEEMNTDAMLVIGDRAIHSLRTGVVDQWDLGEEWCRWTGLPFVFAMWTARRNVDTRELEASAGTGTRCGGREPGTDCRGGSGPSRAPGSAHVCRTCATICTSRWESLSSKGYSCFIILPWSSDWFPPSALPRRLD